MKHDQPLTDEELKSLGFEVVTKKDGTFRNCWYNQGDYLRSEMIGTFYNRPPTFNDIIDQVIDNVKSNTIVKIKESISTSIVGNFDF